MKKALIIGPLGQDNIFLSKFLLEKKYIVFRLIPLFGNETDKPLYQGEIIKTYYSDMLQHEKIKAIIQDINPNELYYLDSQKREEKLSLYQEMIFDAVGVLNFLEAARSLKTCRIFLASSAELFGLAQEIPQVENSMFYPRSQYAIAKLYGFLIMKNYRESYGMFCSNGILYNHESEQRDESFVTRKISLAASRIALGKQDKLFLGNLNAHRDWGYAGDYVDCMWRTLQADKPDDYIIATGKQHTVREFCQKAFKEVGIELEFKGTGSEEKGYNKHTGECLVEVSSDFFIPADIETLVGNPQKAQEKLGWNPQETSFDEMIKIMVKKDIKNERQTKNGGMI